jgi:hypothetical protein
MRIVLYSTHTHDGVHKSNLQSQPPPCRALLANTARGCPSGRELRRARSWGSLRWEIDAKKEERQNSVTPTPIHCDYTNQQIRDTFEESSCTVCTARQGTARDAKVPIQSPALIVARHTEPSNQPHTPSSLQLPAVSEDDDDVAPNFGSENCLYEGHCPFLLVGESTVLEYQLHSQFRK